MSIGLAERLELSLDKAGLEEYEVATCPVFMYFHSGALEASFNWTVEPGIERAGCKGSGLKPTVRRAQPGWKARWPPSTA